MILVIIRNLVVGIMSGRVIWRNLPIPFAPSIEAASYNSATAMSFILFIVILTFTMLGFRIFKQKGIGSNE